MRLMSTLLLLSIFVFAGCESYDSHCPPVLDLPEEGQAMDNRPFESAVAELNQAIAATPEWDKRESSRAWVRGLAELAIERADALEPWRSTGEISCGAIELCKLHVKRRAQIATDWRPGPATTADLNKDPEAQIERVRSERAWWRSYEAMPRGIPPGRSKMRRRNSKRS